jgi:ATP-dependent Lon protease
VENVNDIDSSDFSKYCLEPAKEMRQAIRKQLCIVDPDEFDVPGKRDIPDIQVKEGY